jgi:putative ABC transport system substrate-binding protein
MSIYLRRREFIAALGGAAASPLAARAQQIERVRRIGVLLGGRESDPEYQSRVAALRQGLADMGWSEGRTARIDMRWGEANAERTRRYAAELIALAPDIIVAISGFALGALLPATRTIPIVFTGLIDPVGAGFVTSLARPGGNATGFTVLEYGTSGKWLELLKEIAPHVTRVAVIREASGTTGGGRAQFAAIQAVAPMLRVELSPINVSDASEMERTVGTFARGANDGMIVTSSSAATLHRDLIISLAARYRLPTVYPYRYFATEGGLISYGVADDDPFRRAAGYVDRILKGEKPGDLPVQAPTKYELVINLKTAKGLGLEFPATVYARADEVIE